MSYDPANNPGSGGLLHVDPVKMREISRWSLLVSIVLHFVSAAGWIPFSDIIFIVTWVAMPFIGIALGLGIAIVLRHGVGVWRVVVQLAMGVLLVQVGWTFLAIVEIATDRVAGQAVAGLVHVIIYAGALIAVGAFVGLIVGIAWPRLLKRLRDFERSDV